DDGTGNQTGPVEHAVDQIARPGQSWRAIQLDGLHLFLLGSRVTPPLLRLVLVTEVLCADHGRVFGRLDVPDQYPLPIPRFLQDLRDRPINCLNPVSRLQPITVLTPTRYTSSGMGSSQSRTNSSLPSALGTGSRPKRASRSL